MSDYFLGTYGGGILKPFRYTEIQKHTFNLKTKDDSKDRQVPAMPLAFYNRQGKLTRYNLRKFTELPFQLVRCFRYKDLYDNVLFNYQWLYHKMCALPLPEVLCDFEDAIRNIRPDPCKVDNIVKEISLVADSLRLGGAILKFYPGMLSAQLVGRLLPEIEHSDNIRRSSPPGFCKERLMFFVCSLLKSLKLITNSVVAIEATLPFLSQPVKVLLLPPLKSKLLKTDPRL